MKSSTIKLVVADCDGTLLDSNKEIDMNIFDAITMLNEKGIMFTLASGRNFYLMKPIVDKLEIDLPYITNNGGVIYQKDKTIQKIHIPNNYVNKIVNILVDNNLSFLYYCDDVVIYNNKTSPLSYYHQVLDGIIDFKDVNDIDDVSIYDTYKITISAPNHDLMSTLIDEVKSEMPTINFGRSEGNLYTITNINATKGNALKLLANHLNIRLEEVMVFGDNYNDLSMFENAGVAVAMKNSDDEIKNKANFITDSNNENGVSEFIKYYFSS